MKNALLILSLLCTCIEITYAQYTSPSSGKNWNLDSLVANSGGVVTDTLGSYRVNSTLTISSSDTLKILENAVISVAAGVEIKILGTLLINPPDSVLMRPINIGQNFLGMEFNFSSSSVIRKLHQTGGGGNRLLNCNVVFDSCRFIANNSANASNVINLFRSNSIIRNCFFSNNARSAIGGGGNIQNAPLIENCSIIANVTDNSNRPQINLGGTSTIDTTVIRNCVIIGQFTNAGGIGIFPLGIGANICIEDNLIQGNRYGIACLNQPINGFIRRNQIINNNIQGDPNLGGSGINFNGGSTQRVIVEENTISGNLWGITVQGTAKPNMGDLRMDTSNIGLNVFSNNGNAGITYHIYNNTPDTLFAQNNNFGTTDSLAVEATLFHKPDSIALGPIIFDPWLGKILGVTESFENSLIHIYPNPAYDRLYVNTSLENNSSVKLISLQGLIYTLEYVSNGTQSIISLPEMPKGIYLLSIDGKVPFRKKIRIE